jgi:hypothetical protein
MIVQIYTKVVTRSFTKDIGGENNANVHRHFHVVITSTMEYILCHGETPCYDKHAINNGQVKNVTEMTTHVCIKNNNIVLLVCEYAKTREQQYNCLHVIMCSILNLQVRVCIIFTFLKSIFTIAHFYTHPLTLSVTRVLALFCKFVSTFGQKPCKIARHIDTH